MNDAIREEFRQALRQNVPLNAGSAAIMEALEPLIVAYGEGRAARRAANELRAIEAIITYDGAARDSIKQMLHDRADALDGRIASSLVPCEALNVGGDRCTLLAGHLNYHVAGESCWVP